MHVADVGIGDLGNMDKAGFSAFQRDKRAELHNTRHFTGDDVTLCKTHTGPCSPLYLIPPANLHTEGDN